MTELLCSLKNYYSDDVTDPVQQELWSVAYSSFQQSSSRTNLSSPPKLFFLPHAGDGLFLEHLAYLALSLCKLLCNKSCFSIQWIAKSSFCNEMKKIPILRIEFIF